MLLALQGKGVPYKSDRPARSTKNEANSPDPICFLSPTITKFRLLQISVNASMSSVKRTVSFLFAALSEPPF